MRYAYFLFAALLTMALYSGMASAAQVYKWVDENGKTHYGDRPQQGAKAEAMRLHRAPESARQASSENSDDGDSSGGGSFMEKRTEKKMAASNQKKDADRDAQLEKFCDSLKQKLRILSSGQSVKTINDKGETVWYDEARIKKEIAEVKQGLKAKCSGKK